MALSIIGTLSAVIVYDSLVNRHNRKVNIRLRNENQLLVEKFNKVAELTKYYAAKLDQLDVPCDEFDRIIMNDLTS